MYKKKDHYHQKAKQQGYRSRSAFKLKQINNKFSIIKKGHAIVDVGAAPGGWSQVAAELVGSEGEVIGIDLEEIDPLPSPNVTFIKGDITDEDIIEEIKKHVEKIDCVISDIAPKTTGIIDLDRSRSAILSMQALEVACALLRDGGNFLTKVFQSEESEELFRDMKQCFSYTKRYRPPSTRKRSTEIYLVGKGFNR
ncbi:RlmE family RNA methyltransferase [archaeon]|nr:MAG: RlmE family RNA methyltransferase [archaeon]